MRQPKATAPWMPTKEFYVKADVAALQALFRSEANAAQQARAVEYILGTICGVREMSYRAGPDGVTDTAFAEGRRFVGSQLVTISNMSKTDIEDKIYGKPEYRRKPK